MKKKAFDCIQMKRDVQQKIRAAVQGMTQEEEIAYFREGAEEFERKLRSAKNVSPPATDKPAF